MNSKQEIESTTSNTKKLIVHIATDEKFINSAYEQFESLDGIENKFYILVDDINEKLKYVKLQENMFLVQHQISKLRELSKSFINSSLVCFHSLNYPSSIVINSLPKDHKTLWMFFGFEIYNNSDFFSKKELFGKKTYSVSQLEAKSPGVKDKIKNVLRTPYYKFIKNSDLPSKELIKGIKRADYLGILYKEEYDLVKDKIRTNIEHFKFTYYPIEKMVTNPETFVSGKNILLGNSASYTNNHLEAFEILSHFNLNNHKVITPLSYGDENYRTIIESEGKRLLKSNFEALVNFMPLHKYNNYIQSCSIVVMNHYRQQAVGNVLTMLWMGAKVYLDKRNTLYHYLKRINVIVFEITKDLNPNNALALAPLTKEEQLHNRKCLSSDISEKEVLTELQQQLDCII